MRRFGLVFLVVLLGFTGPAFAQLTVVNQSSAAVTATLTQSQSQSSTIPGNASWVPGQLAPPLSFTLLIKVNGTSLSYSKSFGSDIQTATFRRQGQAGYNIILSTTPASAAKK